MTVSSPLKPFAVPDIADPGSPVRVIQWLIEEGTPVSPGDRVVELLVDGVLVHVSCDDEGTLARIEQPNGGDVAIGDILAWVRVDRVE